MRLVATTQSASLHLVDHEPEGPRLWKVLLDPAPPLALVARLENELAWSQELEIDGVRRGFRRVRHEGRAGIELAWIEGRSFGSLRASTRGELLEVLVAAESVATTLTALHRRGVIHRGIKPSAIVVRSDLSTGLIDLGRATSLVLREPSFDASNLREASLAYLAPEQTGRLARAVDARADLYSFGATLYHALTGRPPFASDDPLELVRGHLAGAVIPPSELNSLVPGALSGLVVRLLAKEPSERPPTVASVVDELRACRGVLEGRASPSTNGVRPQAEPRAFSVPERLFGRDDALERLRSALGSVGRDGPRLVLLTGAAGVGKTSLVHELFAPLTRDRGLFAGGKFEELSRDVPFSALAQALGGLVRWLLTLPSARLERLRDRVRDALSGLAGALEPALPELPMLLGASAELPTVDAAARQERLHVALVRLLGALSSAEAPLVLFLDDLQWADLASLEALEAVVSSAECPHALVLGAYRDVEIEAGHRLALVLEELRGRGYEPHTIALDALTTADVTEMLVEACDGNGPPDLPRVAALLRDKTAGNPLLVRAAFEWLVAHDGVTRGASGEHRFAPDALESIATAESAVELMRARLDEASTDELRCLGHAACLGSTFTLGELAAIASATIADTGRRVAQLVELGLLVPRGGSEQVARALEHPDAGAFAFAFAHDRVAHDAYAALEPSARAAAHRAAAKRCATKLPRDPFELAHHTSRAITAESGQEERLTGATIHAEAAERALASGAFPVALVHARAATALLPEDAWSSAYELTLRVHAQLVESAGLLMDHPTVQSAAGAVISNARRALERAPAYDGLAMVSMAQRDLLGAVEQGRLALVALGAPLPARARPYHLAAALLRLKLATRGRVEALADAPALDDERVKAAVSLIARLMPAAFRGKSPLFPLLVFELARLSARHGNSPEAAFGWASFGIAQAAVFHDFGLAYRFGQLASTIAERHPNAGACFIVDNFLRHWREPVAAVAPAMGRSYRRAVELGDRYQATWLATYRVLYALLAGSPLPAVREGLDGIVEVVAWDQGCASVRRMLLQFVHSLTSGRLGEPVVLEGTHYGEAIAEARFRENSDTTELGQYRFFGALLALFDGDAARACVEAGRAFDCLDGLSPMPFEPLLHALGEVADQRHARREGRSRARATRAWRPQRYRAEGPNYAHLAIWARAERDFTRGALRDAADGFEQALARAQAIDAPTFHIALIARGAAELAHASGHAIASEAYAQRAAQALSAWGATRLTPAAQAELERSSEPSEPASVERASGIRPRSDRAGAVSSPGGGPAPAPTNALDWLAVQRAATAISCELRKDELVRDVLTVLTQLVGAERATLFELEHGEPRALATLEGNRIVVDPPRETALGRAATQLALRTGAPVLADDATSHALLGTIDDVRTRRVRSLLAYPLKHQGKSSGAIYLENTLVAGVFDQARLEAVELLAAMTSAALANARLYEELEARVDERTSALVREQRSLRDEKAKSDELLLNILPVETARELKETGRAKARRHEELTVLFFDIVGFSKLTLGLSPDVLVRDLDRLYGLVDDLVVAHGLEKIKIIGDAYMCVGGLDGEPDAAERVIRAAFAMLDAAAALTQSGETFPIALRVGVHTGPAVTGVVGRRKFVYDVWGDTVNIAARLEQSGEPGRVNVSRATFERVAHAYDAEPRGAIAVKNIGPIEMVFLARRGDELPPRTLRRRSIAPSAA